ncbi:LIC10906 family membrane protein [Leptospira interrogans]|uniref:LIC10906 family membrane protein n=1 Tax=Leptospira interrogans TaxID=173 RepID=UPI00077310C6|nr:histidine kinase N-terminal 7TM domain-containing protein [Leptospira interrogans]
MNFSNLLCVLVAIFILFLGIYTYFLPDRKKIQSYFLYFTICFSIWLFSFVGRQFVSFDFRHIVLDWMLIPTIFFPILLDKIISLISDPEQKESKWKIGILFLIVTYFLWAAITCSYSINVDRSNFNYTSTIHYHIFISYQIVYVGFSILKLVKLIYKKSGAQRVRLTLMCIGVITMLSFALIFIYILPLNGMFYGSLSSIGALIHFIFWTIAILQYNAFDTKYSIFVQESVPLLNKISINLFLFLFKILDPIEFRKSDFLFKRFFYSRVLYAEMQLREKTDLDFFQRAEVLARRYDRCKINF